MASIKANNLSGGSDEATITGTSPYPDSFTSLAGSPTYETADSPTGGSGVSAEAGYAAAVQNVGWGSLSLNESYWRFYYKAVTSLPSADTPLMDLRTSSSPKLRVWLATNGTLSLQAGFTSQDSTAASTVSADNWYRIEVYHQNDTGTPANSTGTIRLYNEAGTLLDTLTADHSTFNATIDQVRFGALNSSPTGSVAYWAEFASDDTAWVGGLVTPQKVRPASDVTTTGWTTSTGTDYYALLDEATASDTDYIQGVAS